MDDDQMKVDYMAERGWTAADLFPDADVMERWAGEMLVQHTGMCRPRLRKRARVDSNGVSTEAQLLHPMFDSPIERTDENATWYDAWIRAFEERQGVDVQSTDDGVQEIGR